MTRRVFRRRLNILQIRHAHKKGEKPQLPASREERNYGSHGHEVWHKSFQNGFVPLLVQYSKEKCKCLTYDNIFLRDLASKTTYVNLSYRPGQHQNRSRY